MDNGNQNPSQQSGQQLDSNQLQIAPNALPGYNRTNGSQPIRTANGGVASGKSGAGGIIKTVVMIFAIVFAIGFACLSVFLYVKWRDSETDVDGQVNRAVATAENKLRTKLEDEFAEREKYPYNVLSTPSDLGSLTLEYPRTWSVYIPKDGNSTDVYQAYLNPSYVGEVSDKAVFAVRLEIKNTSADKVKETYANYVKKGTMTITSTVVNGANVDVYTGTLPSKNQGIVCIIKIRDKTAIIQTDSVLFTDDFYRVLGTVKFNA